MSWSVLAFAINCAYHFLFLQPLAIVSKSRLYEDKNEYNFINGLSDDTISSFAFERIIKSLFEYFTANTGEPKSHPLPGCFGSIRRPQLQDMDGGARGPLMHVTQQIVPHSVELFVD